MAIADLATASSDTTASSLTFSHTVGGSSNLALWVCVDSWASSAPSDPTGITYAGAALTELADFLGGAGNDNVVSVWRKTAPATGANNVVVTHSKSHDITAMSISYSGVDQTTPNDTVQENDVTTADPTHDVTSESGDKVVSFVFGWGLGADAWSITAGALTLQLENNNTSGVNSMAVGDAPGAATVTCSWNSDSIGDAHGQLSFNVNQASSGVTGTIDSDIDEVTGSLNVNQSQLTTVAALLDELTASLNTYMNSGPNIVSLLEEVQASLNATAGNNVEVDSLLDELTAAINLLQSYPANIVSTLDEVTASLNVIMLPTTTIDSDIEEVTASLNVDQAAGGEAVTVTVAALIEELQSAITLAQQYLLTVVSELGEVAFSGMVDMLPTGTVQSALDEVTGSLSLLQSYPANIASTLDEVTMSLTITHGQQVTVGSTLDEVASSVNVNQKALLTVDSDLDEVSASLNASSLSLVVVTVIEAVAALFGLDVPVPTDPVGSGRGSEPLVTGSWRPLDAGPVRVLDQGQRFRPL